MMKDQTNENTSEKTDAQLEEIIGLYKQCDERGSNDILAMAQISAEMTKKFKKYIEQNR